MTDEELKPFWTDKQIDGFIRTQLMSNALMLSRFDRLLEQNRRLVEETKRLKRTINHIDPHGQSPDYAPLVAANDRLREAVVYALRADLPTHVEDELRAAIEKE